MGNICVKKLRIWASGSREDDFKVFFILLALVYLWFSGEKLFVLF